MEMDFSYCMRNSIHSLFVRSYQHLKQVLSYLILGTRGPVWLNGSNPVNVGENKTLTACARVRSECCRLHWNIQVKKCSEMSTMFFVYKLQAVRGCPMAYCAGQNLQLVYACLFFFV